MQHVILSCATTQLKNDRSVILTGDPLSHIWQNKYIQDNFSIRTFKKKIIGMTKELVMPEPKNQIGIMKEIKVSIANHVRKSNRIRLDEYGFTIPYEPELSEIARTDEVMQIIYDDSSGKILPEAEVWKARMEELEELERCKVWTKVAIEECLQKTGKKPIQTRWVDINEGDNVNQH